MRRLEPLDRVNGGLTDWPGGYAPYAYGVGFHEYLADRYGAETFARARRRHGAARAVHRLARVQARLRQIARRPVARLRTSTWRAKRAGTSATVRSAITRLTHQGFTSAAAVRASRCATVREIVYRRSNAARFSRARIAVPRRRLGAPRRLAHALSGIDRRRIGATRSISISRSCGATSASTATCTRSIAASGDVRALTSDARLLDPGSVARRPHARVRADAPGRRDLVLSTRRSEPSDDCGRSEARCHRRDHAVSEPDTQFNAPRWSPDGRSIAVERHRLGALLGIVLVDVATRAVRVVASQRPRTDRHARLAAATAAPSSPPSASKRRAVQSVRVRDRRIGRRASSRTLTGGATWPDVSPDGRTIVFVGYTATASTCSRCRIRRRRRRLTGQRVLETRPRAAPPMRCRLRSSDAIIATLLAVADARTDVVGAGRRERQQSGCGSARASAATTSLQYHAYAASASRGWSAVPAGAAHRRRGDARLAGCRTPTTAGGRRSFVSASTQTSFFAGPADRRRRCRRAPRCESVRSKAGVVLPFVHTRVRRTRCLASLVRAIDDYHAGRPGDLAQPDARCARAWTIDDRAHLRLFDQPRRRRHRRRDRAKLVRRALGAFADATTFTGGRARVPAGLRAASRARPSRGRREHPSGDVRRAADVSARRRLGRMLEHVGLRPRAPSACCAASAPTRSPAATSPC